MEMDQFATLKVARTRKDGAMLEWGQPELLHLPAEEQRRHGRWNAHTVCSCPGSRNVSTILTYIYRTFVLTPSVLTSLLKRFVNILGLFLSETVTD